VYKGRIVFLFGSMVLAFLAVEVWLFSLQIVRGEGYRAYAERQSVGLRPLDCARARILTRDGEVLVEDRLQYDVCVVIGRLDPGNERSIRNPLRRLFYVPRNEKLVRINEARFELQRDLLPDGTEKALVKARSKLDVEIENKDGEKRAELVERRVEFELPARVAESVERLAEITGGTEEAILNDLLSTAIDVARLRVPVFMEVPIVRNVEYDVIARIETRPERYRGFVIRPRFGRVSPQGRLAPHLLGYVSSFTPRDVERALERYQGWPGRSFFMKQRIGKTGIEKELDEVLRGEFGMECFERNHMNQRQQILADAPPTPGRDVVLSLDSKLQKIVQEALSSHVGAAVLMDVKTGEILAAASAPAYEPERFREMEYYASLRENPDHPLFDRAFHGQFPLGSVFKLMTALAGLESGRIPNSVNCTGAYRHGNRTFVCHRRYGHGELDVTHALKYSCNVYFYAAAHKMSYEPLFEMARRFGFGNRTGIQTPGEPDGLLPRSAPGGQLMNLSIGQGELLVSPLQVAQMMAAIANDGVMMPATLVKSLLPFDTPGAMVAEPINDPRRPVDLKLSRRGLDAVQVGMYKVVNEHGGTGYRAFSGFNRPFKVCGKSSTAQRRVRRDGRAVSDNVGWFAGYAPHTNPRVAFAVAVERLTGSDAGGGTAGPVARRILEAMLGLAQSEQGSEQ